MIFRILTILAILLFGLYLFRGEQSTRNRVRDSKAGKRENLVKCHYCQVYISEFEAHSAEGLYYCSEEHKNRARSG